MFSYLFERIKDNFINSNKSFLNFNETKYRKKIIKFITNFRKTFANFIFSIIKEENKQKYLFYFIKMIISDESSYLINESLIKEILNYIKHLFLI